jgi:hypothetical protein
MSLRDIHKRPISEGGRPNTDLWPDVSEYSPAELYPAPGLKFASGEQAKLFSSRHPLTVQRYVVFLTAGLKSDCLCKAFPLDGTTWRRRRIFTTICGTMQLGRW